MSISCRSLQKQERSLSPAYKAYVKKVNDEANARIAAFCAEQGTEVPSWVYECDSVEFAQAMEEMEETEADRKAREVRKRREAKCKGKDPFIAFFEGDLTSEDFDDFSDGSEGLYNANLNKYWKGTSEELALMKQECAAYGISEEAWLNEYLGYIPTRHKGETSEAFTEREYAYDDRIVNREQHHTDLNRRGAWQVGDVWVVAKSQDEAERIHAERLARGERTYNVFENSQTDVVFEFSQKEGEDFVTKAFNNAHGGDINSLVSSLNRSASCIRRIAKKLGIATGRVNGKKRIYTAQEECKLAMYIETHNRTKRHTYFFEFSELFSGASWILDIECSGLAPGGREYWAGNPSRRNNEAPAFATKAQYTLKDA